MLNLLGKIINGALGFKFAFDNYKAKTRGGRIAAFVWMTMLTAGSLFLFWFALDLFMRTGENFANLIWGIFVMVFAAYAAAAAFKQNSMYSLAAIGCLREARKAKREANKNQTLPDQTTNISADQPTETITQETPIQETTENTFVSSTGSGEFGDENLVIKEDGKDNTKVIDTLVAIFGFVYGLGMIAAVAIIFVETLKQ